jgi:hypothetical protein
LVRITLVWVCAFAAACSGASSAPLGGGGRDSGPPPEQDAGRAGDDGPAGPVDSSPPRDDGPSSVCNPSLPTDAACNSLAATGPLVPLQCINATAPAPKGGTIADGIYVLTSSVSYGATCPMPEQDRDTWLLCGTNWQTAQEHTMGTDPPQATSYDLVVTPAGASQVALQITCGGGLSSFTFGYDATPTTLTFYVGGGRVDTYTRQ